jgi:hypothetical protein
MEKRNGRVGTFLRSESLQKVDKMTKHNSEEKRTTVGLLKLQLLNYFLRKKLAQCLHFSFRHTDNTNYVY